MNKSDYEQIEAFMLTHMTDSAHDPHHIYRVLNAAVDIARYESGVDMDVLIAACILHDIGREQQFADHSLCHAQIGSEMAYDFLISQRWETSRASHVQACIITHRFRKGNIPASIEAKILFDADKLEAAGAMGIMRTLSHGGQVNEPLYVLSENGNVEFLTQRAK